MAFKKEYINEIRCFIFNARWLTFMFSALALTLCVTIFLFNRDSHALYLYLISAHIIKRSEGRHELRESQRDVTHLVTGDTTSVVLFKKPAFVLFLFLGNFFFFFLHISSKENTFRPVGKCTSSFFSDGQNNIWGGFVWNNSVEKVCTNGFIF